MTSQAALAVFVTVLALAQAAHYKQTKGRCYHPIPGTYKLMLGVDITKLDTFTRAGEDGLTKPLFEFSCDKTIKLNDQKVQKPNPVRSFQPHERGDQLFNNPKMIDTPAEARRQIAFEFGVIDSYGEFGFTNSLEFTKMRDAIMKDGKIINDVTAWDYAIDIRMKDPKFLRMVSSAYQEFKNLKGEYLQNPEQYNKIVEKYGTHYYHEATLGGVVRTLQKTDASFWATGNAKKMDFYGQVAELFYAKTHGILQEGHTKVPADEEFMKYTDAETEVYGGDAKLFEEGHLKDWQQSVNDNPYILSGNLMPISELVRDPQAKDALDDAIRTYIINSFLTDLEHQMDAMTSAHFQRKIEDKDMHEMENIRNAIKGIKSSNPIKEEDLYFAKKVSAIFEDILRRYVALPMVAPTSKAHNWQDAINEVVYTQVVKAQLRDLIQQTKMLQHQEFIPPMSKDELEQVTRFDETFHEYLGLDVLNDEHEDTTRHYAYILNTISQKHIIAGEGAMRNRMEMLVNEQMEHRSKDFDNQLNIMHEVKKDIEHQNKEFGNKLNDVHKMTEFAEHQAKEFDHKINEMNHVTDEFNHQTKEFADKFKIIDQVKDEIAHKTKDWDHQMNEVHMLMNEKMPKLDKEFEDKMNEMNHIRDEFEHGSRKFDDQQKYIDHVRNEMEHMSHEFNDKIHVTDEINVALDHQRKEFDSRMQDMSKMGEHFDKEFQHIDEKLSQVEKMAAEGGAGPKPDPKHYGKWAISAIVDEINRSGRVMFSVILYGTKGWTETLPMAFGERKLKHGSVITDTFETDDIGRPLKMVVFLEGDQGVKLEQFKLSNGDNSYYLNVRRWLAPHTMDDQTRMELEFP